MIPRKTSYRFGLAFGVAAQALSIIAHAQTAPASPAAPTATVRGEAVGADLNLSPKRVVFDETNRTATVFVFNQGATSGVYTVELVDEIMLPDGHIEKVADAAADPAAAQVLPKLKSAKDLMLVTPHRVSLSPHDSQTIRVRVHPPADGAAGEYRTHLVITALPPEDTGLTADQASTKAAATNLSVKVIALYSLGIPLFYRQGGADSRGHMDHLTLSPEGDHSLLEMDMMRDGATSLFGDVEVRADGPKGEVVGLVDGVGVYPEIDHRHVKLSLKRKVASGEHLTIVWRDQDAKPGSMLATSELTAP
jgi:P pilus assembly chaperone PapD